MGSKVNPGAILNLKHAKLLKLFTSIAETVAKKNKRNALTKAETEECSEFSKNKALASVAYHKWGAAKDCLKHLPMR